MDNTCTQEERILLFSLISRVDHYKTVDDRIKNMIDDFIPLNNLFGLIS